MKIKTLIKGAWAVINSRIFLIILIVIALSFALKKCSENQDLERDKKIKDQNIEALSDSLHFEKNKNGKLNIEISGYISSVKKLEELNKDLFYEIKNQRGKVLSLNQLVLSLKQNEKDLKKYISLLESKFDSITNLNDSIYIIPWTLAYRYDSTNFDVFKGNTQVSAIYDPNVFNGIKMNNLGSNLIERETQIELVWGQKVVNDKLKVFATSNYPGFNASQMQGVLIDPNDNPYIKDLIRKRHWFTGFNIGIGIMPGYDILSNNFILGVGPTFNFTIYEF